MVIDTTIPGRVPGPTRVLVYSARAAAPHCEVEQKLSSLPEDPAQAP